MAKRNDHSDAQYAIAMMFPDDKERIELLQSALLKLHPETPKGDKFNKPINMADLIIEMLKIRNVRKLTRLIVALTPDDARPVRDLLDGADPGSVTELAHVYGVSEGTVVKQWIPDGMPISHESEA